MANLLVSPTFYGPSWSGVSLDLTGTAITGTVVGDWIIGLGGLYLSGIAMRYIDANGTAVSAAITYHVQIGTDSTEYSVLNTGASGAQGAVYTTFNNADGNFYTSFGPAQLTAGQAISQLGAIRAIRATAVIGVGTGGVGDVLRVALCGYRHAA